MRRAVTVIVFLVVVLGAGFAIGGDARTMVRRAQQAAVQSPNWVFAPVWTLLYVMIAVAGARTYERVRGFSLWVTQMALNFA